MCSEITSFKVSALPSLEGLEDNLAQAVTEISSNLTMGGKPILKFTSGEWLFGAEEYDVEENSLWAADPTSYRWGWVRFSEEGKLLGDITVPITEKRPEKPPIPDDGEIDDHGKPIDWQEKYALNLLCLNGEDKGAEVVYFTNTYGGRKLMAEFTQRLLDQVRKGDDRIIAVVSLSSESYKHTNKTYGTVYNPIFEYKEWRRFTPIAENDDVPPEETAKEAAEEAPKKRRRRTTKPKEETKVAEAAESGAESETEDAPAPRRRRRARQAS